MMEQNATRVGRQAPQPFPEPEATDPKQQQTMFPRRSCAKKFHWVPHFWEKKRKKRRETNPGTRARNQPENHDGTQSSSWERKEKKCRETRPRTLGNHDGTQCHNTRETSPTTLPGTRWNQDMLMEQNARRLGRQSPEPNRNQKTEETMMEQNARIPGTKKSWWNKNTPELFGQQEPKP